MKKRRHLGKSSLPAYAYICLLSCSILLNGCEKENTDIVKYESKEEIRGDVETFVDLVLRKQELTLNLIKYSSDNFIKPPFEGTISEIEYKEFFEQIAEMSGNIEAYERAIARLEKSKILDQATTKGIVSSTKAFFGWLSGSSERSRNRVLTVASNLDERERTDLYNKLRPEWKAEVSGEKDFWDKLGKGEFDNQASQMYNDFMVDNTEFAITASEKGLTIQSIVVAEGAAGIKAGGDMMVDVIGTATPLGTGMSAVSIVNNTHELVAKEGTWTDKARIATSIISDLAGVAIKDPLLELLDGGMAVDAVAETISELHNRLKTSNNPAELIPESDELGVVKVKDESTGSKADVLIAQNPKKTVDNSPSIMIVVGSVIENGNEYLNAILSAGNWFISAIDREGNVETQKIPVAAGEEFVVYVTTEQMEEEEGGSTADWDKYAKTYPVMNKAPKFAYPIYRAQKNEMSAYGYSHSGVNLTYNEGVMTQARLDDYLEKLFDAGFAIERMPDYETNGITKAYNCYIQYDPDVWDRLVVTIYFFKNSMSTMNIVEQWEN